MAEYLPVEGCEECEFFGTACPECIMYGEALKRAEKIRRIWKPLFHPKWRKLHKRASGSAKTRDRRL